MQSSVVSGLDETCSVTEPESVPDIDASSTRVNQATVESPSGSSGPKTGSHGAQVSSSGPVLDPSQPIDQQVESWPRTPKGHHLIGKDDPETMRKHVSSLVQHIEAHNFPVNPYLEFEIAPVQESSVEEVLLPSAEVPSLSPVQVQDSLQAVVIAQRWLRDTLASTGIQVPRQEPQGPKQHSSKAPSGESQKSWPFKPRLLQCPKR